MGAVMSQLGPPLARPQLLSASSWHFWRGQDRCQKQDVSWRAQTMRSKDAFEASWHFTATPDVLHSAPSGHIGSHGDRCFNTAD